MNIGRRLRSHLTLAIVLMLLPLGVSAQPLDTRRVVDTLSIMDRLSIRTNATDWLLMVPNVGVEFDIRNNNWNRWAVNLNLRYRPGSNTSTAFPLAFEYKEVKLEGRMYWRERKAQPSGPMAYHVMPWHKLMSCRVMHPKHPNTVYYRGVYAAYGKFDFLADFNLEENHIGYKGDVIQTGLTWGFVKPLYAFSSGNSIDMEIGVSGGLAIWKYTRYKYVSTNENGRKVFHYTPDQDDLDSDRHPKKHTKPLPMINDIHVGLVYRLGKYPIQKRYRWRYDVDMDFRARVDSAWMMRDRNRTQKLYRDSVYKVVANDFRETYDSVITIRHQEKQERIDKSAPQRKIYIKVLRDSEAGRQALRDVKAGKAILKGEED